jgi:hypothetical protein
MPTLGVVPATEPEIKMIVPCPTCGGTGEREEQFAGGTAMAAGGGPLRCQTCDGRREVVQRVTLTKLRDMLGA